MLAGINFQNLSFGSVVDDFERGFLVLIFGRMGSGKSVTLTKLIVESLNKGYVVYANFSVFWYGKLKLLSKIQVRLNKWYARPKYLEKQEKKLNGINLEYKRLKEIQDYLNSDDVQFDAQGAPLWKSKPIDPQKVYSAYANAKNEVSDQFNHIQRCKTGFFKSYFFKIEALRRIETREDIIAIKKDPKGRLSVVVVDEAHTTFPSLDPRKIPPEVLKWVTHIRKNNIVFLVASQRISSVWNMIRINSTYMLHLKKLRLGPFGQFFIANKYFADKTDDGIPNWETEEPVETFVHTGKKYFKHYSTFEEIGHITEK